jgi:senataxin
MPVIPDEEVLAFLKTRENDQGSPPTDPLTSVHEYLKQSPVSPSDGKVHWYCPQTASPVHKQVATYLIYFFAFNRTSISAEWQEGLEELVERCEGCARGFCRARTIFTAK